MKEKEANGRTVGEERSRMWGAGDKPLTAKDSKGRKFGEQGSEIWGDR
jgi:hypothetical protein